MSTHTLWGIMTTQTLCGMSKYTLWGTMSTHTLGNNVYTLWWIMSTHTLWGMSIHTLWDKTTTHKGLIHQICQVHGFHYWAQNATLMFLFSYLWYLCHVVILSPEDWLYMYSSKIICTSFNSPNSNIVKFHAVV